MITFLEKLYVKYRPGSGEYYEMPDSKLLYSFQPLYPMDMKAHWTCYGFGGGSYNTRFINIYF